MELYLDWSGLYLQIGLAFILLPIAGYLIFLLINKFTGGLGHEVELNIPLGSMGTLKIKQNHDVVQVAHKAWTELTTRKAGILFDQEHDLIVEVYDSWYVLFSEIRNLIKNIPASRLKEKNTKKLVGLLVDSLNLGLRPHLTKWQAKFRRWYSGELDKKSNIDNSPQEIQMKYPHYKELVSDLLKINKQLIAYMNELKKLTS